MSRLSRVASEWNVMAELDPLWAILSNPENKNGQGDLVDFFASGQSEVDAFVSHLAAHGIPTKFRRALDFGCGFGRLTSALRSYADEAIGIDISPIMLGHARELNRDCSFVLNERPDLSIFADGTFDLVYSSIVLHHQASEADIVAYLSEFCRVLGTGGVLYVQLTTALPWKRRIQPRRRAYHLLHTLGFTPKFLYEKLSLYSIRITPISKGAVHSVLGGAGFSVVSSHSQLGAAGSESTAFYAIKSD